MPRGNKYKKTWNILKSKQIDERLKYLDEGPTNSTSGSYIQTPGYYTSNTVSPDPDAPGAITSVNPDDKELSGTDVFDVVTRNNQLDLDADDPEQNGQDTSGLFFADGTTRGLLPPGDTTAILGPMMSMWYAWGNFTQIGYIREADRKMVNLARITGPIESWDGESGFTSYGSLTIDQAKWFKDQNRADYRAFYPGPPSNPADSFGRYLGSIVTGSNANVLDYLIKIWNDSDNTFWDPRDWLRYYDFSDNELALMDNMGSWLAALAALGFVFKSITEFINWFNKQDPEMKKKLRGLVASARGPYGTPGADKPYTRQGYKDKDGKFVDFDNPKTWPSIVPKLPRASLPPGTTTNPYGGDTVAASYKPEEKTLLSESRRRSILKNVKKPVPKLPDNKIKYKSSGRDSKGNKTIGKGLMPEPDAVKHFNPAKQTPSVWLKGDKDRNIRSSQEKKNAVLELVGESDHFWEKLIEKNQRGFDNSKKKIEEENEKISEMISNEMQKEYEKYMIKERKVDKLIDFVKKFDYEGRPATAGYPNNPPPETVNGYHPDLVDIDKRANYYNGLDPQTARAMPKTVSKVIDAKVRDAARKAKIKGERRPNTPNK
jgi:hypothetical protein